MCRVRLVHCFGFGVEADWFEDWWVIARARTESGFDLKLSRKVVPGEMPAALMV